MSIYRVVNRSLNVIHTFTNPADVACRLLGRRLDNYMVIKTDDKGDRLVPFTSSDVAALSHSLSIA
jgi:hypothetical protein